MAKKEYTYEEICRDIVAKKFAPVYIMMGDEPFFMDQITDLLLENVLEESERDFNQIIMYGADTDAASIINAARDKCRHLVVGNLFGLEQHPGFVCCGSQRLTTI